MSKRTMLVTGAANGIGQEIAVRAAAEDYTVAVADIDGYRGEAVVESIRSTGGDAFFVEVDMADVTSVAAMVNRVVAEKGRLDVLVNNAAVTQALGFFEVTPESWQRFFDVNARGVFFATQVSAVTMRETGGGSVVNISSISGKGWTGTSNIAYASTKGAVIAMTRVAASQLGGLGIRVNAVCPGVTDTNLLRDVLETRAADRGTPVADLRDELSSLASLRRITQPGDVAATTLFLASPAAGGITGQTVNVDSGIMWD